MLLFAKKNYPFWLGTVVIAGMSSVSALAAQRGPNKHVPYGAASRAVYKKALSSGAISDHGNAFYASNLKAGKLLGWVIDSNAPNLCGGYFAEIPLTTKHKVAPAVNKSPIKITAQKTSVLVESGKSVLRGDVTITEPGRQVLADKAIFWRDKKSGKIEHGHLLGNVSLREYGKLILGSDGHINLHTNITTMNNAVYRLATPVKSVSAQCVNCSKRKSYLSAWGRAKKVVRDDTGILHFSNASYSTCSPTCHSWHIHGKKVNINKSSGWGDAYNAWFYVHKARILYLPYLSFPLDKRRKSGFLYPTFSYTYYGGPGVSVPYYFNLAPNQDLTITPDFILKRGVFADAEYRYLTKVLKGFVKFGGILNDRGFRRFRSDTFHQYPKSRYTDRLRDASLNRGFFSLRNQAKFNEHWSSNLILNHVSDDYFLQDFSVIPNATDDDQLLNEANLKYISEHWDFVTRVQGFQTLHPISQSKLADNSQYFRLPQILLNGEYPNSALGLDYSLDSEFVNFQHDKLFLTDQAVLPVGSRAEVSPSVGLPLNSSYGYVLPRIGVQGVAYSLHNQNPSFDSRLHEAIPIVSLDSGLTFDREIKFFNTKYDQTLEPRLFYLWVPYHNQDANPLFDTTLPTLNLDQMFRENRFSNVDRLGDANQVVFALTTRLMDDYTGDEKMRFSVGEAYAFTKHRVCLTPTSCALDPLTEHQVSPVLAQLKYNLSPKWSITGTSAWDPNKNNFANYNAGLRYTRAAGKVFNVSYNYARDGDAFYGLTKDLRRLDLSLEWPLFQNWNFIGDYNYNISYTHPETYLIGIEYQSCCWALRFVNGRTFTGLNADGSNQFRNRVYIQLMLKGMGSVGNKGVGALLKSRVSGFSDAFVSQPMFWNNL